MCKLKYQTFIVLNKIGLLLAFIFFILSLIKNGDAEEIHLIEKENPFIESNEKETAQRIQNQLKKDPKSESLKKQLIHLYIQVGKFDLAIQVIETLKPKSKEIILLQAQAYRGLKSYHKEIELLKQLEKKYPKDEEIKQKLSDVLFLKEESELDIIKMSSQEQELKITELEKALSKTPSNREIRLRLASFYLRINKPQKTIELLKEHTEQLSMKGLSLLADAYSKEGLFKSELGILQIMQSNEEKNLEIKMRMAHVYRKLEENNIKAIQMYREIILVNDFYLPAYQELERIFDKDKNRYEQKAILEVMVKKFDKNPTFMGRLCKLYFEENYNESALETCKKAIVLNKISADNHVYLGLTYKKMEHKEQSEKILLRAAKEFQDSEYAQWAVGQMYYETNKYTKAYDYFEKSVKLNPSSSRSFVSLAQCALALGKYEVALNSFVSACKIDRSTAPVFRKGTAEIYERKEYLWHKKFSAESFKCRE